MNRPTTGTEIAWAHIYAGGITAYFRGFLVFSSEMPDRRARFAFWKEYMEREGFKVEEISHIS